MEKIQEKSLQRETAKIEIPLAPTPFSELDAEIQLAITCAMEKKAFGLIALDLRDIASFTDFFIIATGSNQRQVQAIADEINDRIKKELRRKPTRIEGYNVAEWILVDYGDFIVHIFNREAREFYDLERLWRDARRVEIPSEV